MESKKMLLAATAMVAVSMIAGPSFAQSVDMAVADQATAPAKPAKKAAKDKMVAAAKPAPVAPVAAPTAAPVSADRAEIEALRKQVRELAEQLNDVRLLTSSKIVAVEKLAEEKVAGPNTTFTYANGRPVFATRDGNFQIAFRLRSQFDGGKYFQDANLGAIPVTPTTAPITGANGRLGAGAYFRRMYFGIEGKFMKDFEYEVRLDGGSSGTEQAVSLDNIRLAYTGIEHFAFEIGAWDIGANQEQAMSSGDYFLLERSTPQTIANGIAAGGKRKGVGFRYFRDVNKTDTTADSFYAAAFITGDVIANPNAVWATTNVTNPTTGVVTPVRDPTADGTLTGGVNEAVNLILRSGYRWVPDADTAVAFEGSYSKIISPKAYVASTLPGSAVKGGLASFSDRPEFRGDPTSLISTGNIPVKSVDVWSIGSHVAYQNFILFGNYFKYSMDRDLFVLPVRPDGFDSPEFEGYDVLASWVITGEKRGFNKELFGITSVAPSKPFSLKSGGTGAFEAMVRYSMVDLNYNAGNAGTAAIGGTARNVGGNGATTVLVPTATDGRIRGGKQEVTTLGLSWYANRNVKVTTQYSMVNIDRLNAAGQQQGQDLNILAARLQFAF
jgi:phosphate-selective porin OprO/OprP